MSQTLFIQKSKVAWSSSSSPKYLFFSVVGVAAQPNWNQLMKSVFRILSNIYDRDSIVNNFYKKSSPKLFDIGLDAPLWSTLAVSIQHVFLLKWSIARIIVIILNFKLDTSKNIDHWGKKACAMFGLPIQNKTLH